MIHREDSEDVPTKGNLREMVYAESEIRAYNHLNHTSRGSLRCSTLTFVSEVVALQKRIVLTVDVV